MTIQDLVMQTDLHEIGLLSISIRLILAVIFGGLVGLNRALQRRAAGFRTHILVCLGSTVVMMTNQYMYDVLLWSTDPARLGAQVITGVGFLGAGTILMKADKVQGLTTAAGLWACACIGLAIGVGFYSAALISILLVILSLTKFNKMAIDIYKKFDKGAAKNYAEEHHMNINDEDHSF